jgi:hypothetical protein
MGEDIAGRLMAMVMATSVLYPLIKDRSAPFTNFWPALERAAAAALLRCAE